jgi:SAM-dependent methyltransferase
MGTNDIFQAINDLPAEAVAKIIDRLEFRGKDPAFVRMRETYFDRMQLASCNSILDLGCGTGVATRALARRSEFHGKIIGIDFSKALIDAANDMAKKEGLTERIEFRVGDSHALEDVDNSYDAVLAHTLVSHVTDPTSTLADAARVIAPGGILAVFDGDYASLTFGAGDDALNVKMVSGMLDAVVGNPYVMRQLPVLLREQGMKILDFIPAVHAEAGQGSFFLNLAESYVPMAVNAETIAGTVGSDWLLAQKAASDRGEFFGACNYYAYLAQKPL